MVMDILLVDDNLLMQQVISRLLASLGHTVEVADSATDALALAARRPFGLLLIDMRLPDYDGPELLGMLRRLPGYQQTPAIAISGFGPEHARQASSAGFASYLSKPIEFDTLRATIERFEVPRERAIGV